MIMLGKNGAGSSKRTMLNVGKAFLKDLHTNSPEEENSQQQQENSIANEIFTEEINSIKIMPSSKENGFQQLIPMLQAKKTRLK